MTKVLSLEEVSKPSFSKMLLAFSLIIVAYAISIVAAWGIIKLLPNTMHTLWVTLIANIGATIIIFIFSVIFNNVSFYDPYWSVQPIVIAIYWFILGYNTANLIRQIVVLSVVSFWGLRLTLNWARQWKGLKHEDWRYVRYRKDNPKLFWIIAFTGLEMMPTLVVYLGCIAMYPALVLNNAGFNYLDAIGITIAVGATLIEFFADEQMKIFCKMNDNPDRVMDLGLWAVSRHPNYFGEVSFWWGVFFFGVGAIHEWWWTIAGPIVMVLLFLFISIPLMEKRQIEKRQNYSDYKKRVSVFIPWFPRNK
ncbi:MAG: DUF1295 domain-containing protein [Candidatus Heimdallarchaeota archaeon]|nr:DUF1295 domain-containing protein [Candidatus Heimdallarchaeota archaeon]